MMTGDRREVRLGDLGDIITGRTPPSRRPECFGDKYPFITPSDMDGRKRASTTQRYLSDTGADLLRRNLLPAGSVAVSCIGWQMGKVIMTSRPSFSNQQLNTIIPHDGVDADFLYYSLVPWREYLLALGSATGVRTPILNRSAFSDLRLLMPPVDTQHKIASILSAYDDLIENNLRRIAILEEMAQLIYREWFVRFRSPGHEDVVMVDSRLGPIPQGWRVLSLGSVMEIEKGKKPKVLTDTFHDGLVPYLLIDSMKGGRPQYTQADKMVLAEPDDVVMVMDGASSGVVTFGVSGAVGSTLARLRPRDNTDLTPIVLLLVLRQREDEIRSKNVGAAIPHANKEYLSRMEIALPPREIAKALDQICRPLFGLIWNLTHANQTLRNTRELLLARLVSGELDVSDLDINSGAVGA